MTFINNDQHARVKKNLNEHFRNTECMERDRELEKFLIQKSKIELKLLIDLNVRTFDAWEANANLNFNKAGNRFSFSSKGIKFPHINNLLRSFSVIFKNKNSNYIGDIVIGKNHLTISHYAERRGEFLKCNGRDWLYSDVINNEYKKATSQEVIYGEELILKKNVDIKTDYDFIHTPLVHFYALCNNYDTEEAAVTDLASWRGISEKVFETENWNQPRNGWRQHKLMICASNEELVELNPEDDFSCSFFNEDQQLNFMVDRNTKYKTILPITAWTADKIEQRYYLNIPPNKPYPLLHMAEIAANTEALVIITESIEVAIENQIAMKQQGDSEIFWTSWYGELQAAKEVDWTKLENNKVYYFIKEYTGVSLKQAYKTAFTVYEKIKEFKRTDLHFIEYVQSPKPGNNVFHFMSCEEFEHTALSIIYDDPYARSYTPGFNPITLKKLIHKNIAERKFLLKPVLLERSTTLLYAKTNVGKTWLALCMGYIVSTGGAMFGLWERDNEKSQNNENKIKGWKASTKNKVLYIDYEMDEKSLQDRVKIITRMRFKKSGKMFGSLNKKFFCISKRRNKEDNEKFQRHVTNFVRKEEIKLVVLDNLTAFTQHNDSAKAWEDIHVWLDMLKENGCAVLLIHHTNKAGEQRGTSASTNAVDNVIHMEKANIPGDVGSLDLGVSVHIEKGRDIYGDARKSFYAKLALDSKLPSCQFIGYCSDDQTETANKNNTKLNNNEKKNKLPKDELKTEVLKKLAEDKSIKKIALELKVSISKIYQLPGLKTTLEYKQNKENRRDKKSKRNEQIIELYQKKKTGIALSNKFKISTATVSRVLDKFYVAKIKPLFLNSQNIDIIEISKECDISEKITKRIITKLEVQKIERFFNESKPVGQIRRELNLSPKRIEKELIRLTKKQKERVHIENEILKIKKLKDSGVSLRNIIKQLDLPAKRIKAKYNKL